MSLRTGRCWSPFALRGGTQHSTLGDAMLNFFVALQALAVSARDRVAPRASTDRGATAVEYGLMVTLIAVVIIVAVRLLGNNLATIFNSVAVAI